MLAEAPREATLVVYHTAVLEYVQSQGRREEFVETLVKSRAVWISNEAPRVFPWWAKGVPPAPKGARFLMMLEGEPVAWTGPHGQSIDWFGAP